MKVVLIKDVPGTGRRGDVKDVADGYARNFLLRQKLAEPATPNTLSAMKAEAERHKREMEHELREYQRDAARLDGAEVTLVEKVSASGTLYAAVSGAKIASAVKRDIGINIRPDQIVQREPIKTTGEHRALVRFGHGLEAELAVLVSES